MRRVRTDPAELAAIFAGGFAGAVGRALVADGLPHDAGRWPWATFLVNVAGAFVLGWVATRLPRTDRRRALVGTGFCGALTTFSAMQLELLQMLDRADYGLAAGYAAASVAAGLAAVAVATSIMRPRREGVAAP
jgi:CrcB protein